MGNTTKKLSAGHRKAFGLEDKTPAPKVPSQPLQSYYDRHKLLQGIPAGDIRKGWFTMAHILLAPGARIIDMGCGEGVMTYVMAALNPQFHFTGVDIEKKTIAKAKKTYALPNLDFRAEDVTTGAGFEANSADAVINSFVLHKVYSAARYNERAVTRTLETQFALLKEGGMMFLRDYAVPSEEEYILMEMPEAPGSGPGIENMSEAELLIWYSDHARPVESRGCQGFFLEELPARFPRTRLFRLPYKWAYEFIARKDNRAQLEAELTREYTFFTPREFRKNLRALGSRVLYSAPHWDDTEIQARFDGHFRLYGDDGTPLGAPPTSYIAVAQKMGEKQSLQVHERRTTNKAESRIKVKAMRNDVSGRIFDIATRDADFTDILPYRITEDGGLNVFVHEGLPRGIVNAVPRGGKEIDGKRWSGHMLEAVAVPTDAVLDVTADDVKSTVLFARDWLGLKPSIGALLEEGPAFFPAPDFIDEHVKTRYLRVSESSGPVPPKNVPEEISGFTTAGTVREMSAQCILNAISVGFIPNARLELQILTLFDRLSMQAEGWEDCPLILKEETPDNLMDTTSFAASLMAGDRRFKDVKGTAGQIRTIQSVFIDEGWVEGGIAGMASRDMEFIVSDESTVNKAVVLPLTVDLQGKVMAGLCTEFMPVPQRYQGNGRTVTAPTFPLPKEVTTIEQAKRFIADKFGVTPDKVSRLGESYFCHIGITPQRIFPFAVASAKSIETPLGGPVQFAPLEYIWMMIDKVLDWNIDFNLLSSMRKSMRRLGYDSDMNLKWSLGRETLFTAESAGIANYTDMTGSSARPPVPPALETK